MPFNKSKQTGDRNVAATGGALSQDTLTAARLAMRQQTGPGGALIDVTPWAILVPPALETLAEKTITRIRAIQVADVEADWQDPHEKALLLRLGGEEVQRFNTHLAEGAPYSPCSLGSGERPELAAVLRFSCAQTGICN